jgi:phosphate uptake regulator
VKRKLVKQGASTMMISLPSKWIKTNNLDKGSEIDLTTNNDNSLIITAKEIDIKPKEAKIKITTSVESSIRTIITNAYRLGYDKLLIEFNHPDDINKIKKILTKQLIGYEITETNIDFCKIENITEPSIDHADKIFLKVLFGISELINAIEQIINGEDKIKYVEELEEKIQQYDNFVRRTQSKNPTNKTPLQWIFHNQLIHSQRELFFISEYLTNKIILNNKIDNKINNKNVNENNKHDKKTNIEKIKISKDTKELYANLKIIYNLLKEGYLKKDIKMLESIHELEKKIIYDTGYNLLKKSSGDETILNYRIISAIRGFYLCSSPILGILLWNEN